MSAEREIMEEEPKRSNGKEPSIDVEDAEPLELVLFQVSECYVYMIPPRKTAASYRADEWDVNKWAWEGVLKVISKGEECIIRLEDKSTGELYARAFLREGEPHPVEPVIDSSRYLNKKKTAEEMEQQFQNTASVDYSLKDGETLVLHLKNKAGSSVRSKTSEQSGDMSLSPTLKGNKKEPCLSIIPPPPPPASSLSPGGTTNHPMATTPRSLSPRTDPTKTTEDQQEEGKPKSESTDHAPDDDFGDFQTAGC